MPVIPVAGLERFVPALVWAMVFGGLGGYAWARTAHVRWYLGLATAISVAVILALTLSAAGPLPDAGYLAGVCVTSHWGPGTVDELTVIGEPSLNVALFVPLGVCIALHRGRVRVLALAIGVLMPVAIELVQMQLPALGRYCDVMDVSDNELGLLLGLGGGLVGAAVVRLAAAVRVGESRRPPLG